MANTEKLKSLARNLSSQFSNAQQIQFDQALHDSIKYLCKILDSNFNNNILPDQEKYFVKELIDAAIWHATEVKRSYAWKYATIYRSVNVYKSALDKVGGNGPDFDVRHEHVFTRKYLKQNLLNANSCEEIKEIMKAKAIGCIVTIKEKNQLDKVKNKEGWCRFCAAGVQVYDMSHEEPVILNLNCQNC